ncbi:hypothetical protein [Allosphingosinicella sp.]|uniref:hypothetical protein n=1 Tax=Allosphingosinicella sp. TaxID=2823234 RepID=UPI002F17B22C
MTAITRLGESLGLAVTAEGIEDELVEARLRSIGTYKGQGWLFGKPVPAEEARKLVTARGLQLTARTIEPVEVRPEPLRRSA